MFPCQPPTLQWEPFREDFMQRESHPSILTLTAIYATLRVMTPPVDIASALLTVGQIFSLQPKHIVFDFLRACFLIQLETSNSATTSSSSSSTVKTQKDLGEREALADMFVYIKAPQVLKAMIEVPTNEGVSKDELLGALERIAGCTTLLNEVDARKYDNSLASIVEWLKASGVLKVHEERCDRLLELRNAGLLNRGSGGGIGNSLRDHQHSSRITLIRTTQKACATMEKTLGQQEDEAARKLVPTMLDLILQSGKINVDTVCSVFCAEGTLSHFSARLAAINLQHQQPSSAAVAEESRSALFDITFLLLSRIHQVYEDMRLDELVGGAPQTSAGVFYQWTCTYIQHLESDEPMVAVGVREGEEEWVAQLKRGQPFWADNTNQVDYGALVECVPSIGAALLEEYQKEVAHHEPHREKEMQNVLSTFRRMTCLLLCLVQWLETQKQTLACQSLAKAILLHLMKEEGSGGGGDGDSNHRWRYAVSVVRRSLKQLSEASCPREQPYTWIIHFAQRQLPILLQNEVPDLPMLKEAFHYANQQSWASPDVLAHINRCNKALEQGRWIKCFLMQTLKMWTVDEMDAASELCLTTALTYPVPSLFEIVRQVVEHIFFGGGGDGQSKSNHQLAVADISNASSSSMGVSPYHPHQSHHSSSSYSAASVHKTSATVMAKMLVRTLILLLWAEEQRKGHEKAKAARREWLNLSASERDSSGMGSRKRKWDDPSTAGEPMDQPTSSNSKYADIVQTTVQNVFERFDKMVRGSTLRPPVTFIIFFMHELAKAPRTPYWERLVELMPTNLVFSLARLDPASIPLPMFLSIYDLRKKDEQTMMFALKYACMLRGINR